jgi:hypothetical protein
MMLHGVLSVEKSACEDIIAWLWGKYSSERREKDTLAMGEIQF